MATATTHGYLSVQGSKAWYSFCLTLFVFHASTGKVSLRHHDEFPVQLKLITTVSLRQRFASFSQQAGSVVWKLQRIKS